VEAAGTSAPGAAVCRTGAAARLTTGTSTLGCALSCSSYPQKRKEVLSASVLKAGQ